MKGHLAIITLFFCGALSEAPYAPSGWRPNGPSFELPEQTPVDPRNNFRPQKQEYLPPRTPTQEYGPPEVDVSVQGLPTDEQLPVFQLSPVNGQQYVGPKFNNDLQNLQQNLNQAQAQRDVYREFARQRELEAAYARANANRAQPVPRQFVPSTSTTAKPDDAKSTAEPTTDTNLNQREVADDKAKNEKVTVEVSKQNIQEYAPQFLTPLSQLQSQNQYSPVQLGQLRAPIFYEPSQKQVAYSPEQLIALPGVLAQQQLLQLQQSQLAQAQIAQAQLAQVQAVQPQPQLVQPQYVQTQQPNQQGFAPRPAYMIPQDQTFIPQSAQPDVSQYQPGYDVQAQYPQQPIYLQPQSNQLLPRPQDQQVSEQGAQVQTQGQPQFVYQYQPAYQYQSEYQQPQAQQPLNSYQQQLLQSQLFIQDPSYQQVQQNQFGQQVQNQGSLQSGLDVNQQGNDVDQTEAKDDAEDVTTTAVATAFGARTQPRVYATYGAPTSIPKVQANPGYQYPSSTDPATPEMVTEDGPAVAEANAAAKGGRRPARLRSRQSRIRPVFTLDKSGHLVLAQDQ